MIKIYKILLILVFTSAISLGQDEIRKLSNGFSHGVGDNKIHFSLDDYEIIDVAIDGQTFKKPIIPFGGLKSEEGQPTLPTITTFYQVAPNKSYAIDININSSEWIENIDICPGCHCLTHLPTHLCEKSTVEDRVLMAQMIFENNLRGKH